MPDEVFEAYGIEWHQIQVFDRGCRFAELEAAANANEAALLAVLEAEEQTAASAKQKRAHRGKKKKKGSKTQGVNGAAGDDSLSFDQLDADRGADCSCNSVPGTDSSEATEDAPEAAEHAVITPVCVEELQLGALRVTLNTAFPSKGTIL